MKKAFVASWKGSVQPRRQRKYRYNAPLHIKSKFVGANLAKDLREKHGRRSISVRKGDTIKVLRGQFKGKTGKVERVSLTYSRIFVQGIDITRKDGTKAHIPLEPSNIQIITLSAGKRRLGEKK